MWNILYHYINENGNRLFLEVEWEVEFKSIKVEKYRYKTWEPVYWEVMLLNWERFYFGDYPSPFRRVIKKYVWDLLNP